MDITVAFMAFNRPQYFEKCLQSIYKQITHDDVHLFQDGPIKNTDNLAIQQNINLFKKHFPNGTIWPEESNIGPDINLIKLLTNMFEKESRFVLLGEDDTLFEDCYIKQLEIMIEKFGEDKDVAVINCNGMWTRLWSDEKIFKNYNMVVPAANQFGSLFTTTAWQTLKPYLEIYQFLSKKYSKKDGKFLEVLTEFSNSIGIYGNTCAGVDAFYSTILRKYKKHRIATVPRFAKHIGLEGHNGCKTEEHKNRFIYTTHKKIVENPIFEKDSKVFQNIINAFTKEWFEAKQNQCKI